MAKEEGTGIDEFQEAASAMVGRPASVFVVDIDGFEGPIDVLLQLSREQKVDLAQISILQLAEQYLEFVTSARRTNLELAAEYLVMAAWLAYLKSRLLLPDLGDEDEPSGEEMAAALAFQMMRLEAMQEAGARLVARGRLGQDFFARGAPETIAANVNTVIEVTLFDLLRAYGDHRRRGGDKTLRIDPVEVYSVEDALRHLRGLLGGVTDWENLWRFLPSGVGSGLLARSAMASTFVAALEMVREGELSLRQEGTFGPIYLRPGNRADRRSEDK